MPPRPSSLTRSGQMDGGAMSEQAQTPCDGMGPGCESSSSQQPLEPVGAGGVSQQQSAAEPLPWQDMAAPKGNPRSKMLAIKRIVSSLLWKTRSMDLRPNERGL